MKRKGESARWADLAIRLVLKANSMSAQRLNTSNAPHNAPEWICSFIIKKYNKIQTNLQIT